MTVLVYTAGMRDCSCGATPGSFHVPGCGIERCALCGMQAISCGCVYAVNGIDRETMEERQPEVYFNGPTDEMYVAIDAVIDEAGGRLPWTGEFPGSAACREFDFWCRWVEGSGWVGCDRGHPDATEDLNRLVASARWDRVGRRWVRSGRAAGVLPSHAT